MKILVIDDEQSVTKLISKYLSVKDHDCTISNDGRDGLDLFRKIKFDLVLLDLVMPDFNGYDIIDALEKDDLLKKQKIILFTAASVSDKQLQEFVNKGIKECLQKPLQLTKLDTIICTSFTT